MGLNGPVRQVRAERIYPISAMGAYTDAGVVDVEGFCRDLVITPVAVLVTSAIDQSGDMLGAVVLDFVPIGGDNAANNAMPLHTGEIYDMAVKRVITATTTAAEVFILAINP